jgi:multiple sugar transport system ATP-binding protein
MNVFEGILKNNSVEALGARWPVPAGAKPSDGQPVKYGIRPEHLNPGSVGIRAEVLVVEPLGAETEFLVKIGGTRLTVLADGRSSAKPGDTLSLAPESANAHIFDAASGNRL